MAMDIKLKKCTTPEARAAFVHVITAHRMKETDEAKRSVTLLFPKSTDLKEMKRAVKNARIERWGTDESKYPKNLRSPFRDGDEKADLEGYAGHIYVYASTKEKNKVQIVDSNRDPIIDESEFKSGDYCHASLIAFAYDTGGNRGVSFSLQNILKSRTGKSFSGKKSAAEDFAGIDVKTEDDSTTSEDTDDMGLGL